MGQKNTKGKPSGLTPLGQLYFDEGDYETVKKLLEELPMPRLEYTPKGDSPFGDWRKTIDDAKREEKRPKETALESWAEKWAKENQ